MCITCSYTGTDEAAFHGTDNRSGGFDALDGIRTPFSVPSAIVTVQFATAGQHSGDGVVAEGFNSYEIAQFQAAFDAIEAVANLSFQVVSNAAHADFKLILDTDEGAEYGGAYGYFYYPTGGGMAGTGVFNGAKWDRAPGGDLEEGGFAYITIVHELLHGLGLAHPHDNGGNSGKFPDVTRSYNDTGSADLNQGVYTTMSYNSGVITHGLAPKGDRAGNWGYEAGPMALDIAVLQEKYGANLSHASGHDTYYLPDENHSGTGWRAIWDTGGRDTLVYDGARDVILNLRPATLAYGEGGGGYLSYAEGVAGGFTIAHGVQIEAATGGRGNDHLIGNGLANTLIGGAGHDSLSGNWGHDALYGWSGDDSLWGGNGRDTLNGNDQDDALWGGRHNDQLFGGAGDDQLRGQLGNDRLNGGTGHDRIWGGRGADALSGGHGNDRLDGQTGDDRLWGQQGHDRLTGGQGHDSLYGGLGNDTLIGGGGSDEFRFLKGADQDRITDFTVGEDRLVLSSDLTDGISDPAEVLSSFGAVTASGLLLDFGGGDSLLLVGVTDTDRLAAEISFA